MSARTEKESCPWLEIKGRVTVGLGGADGTQEVADKVGCISDTAYKKLRQLEDSDKVESRKVANARLWSVTEG